MVLKEDNRKTTILRGPKKNDTAISMSVCYTPPARRSWKAEMRLRLSNHMRDLRGNHLGGLYHFRSMLMA